MARYYEETALIEFVKQYIPTIEGETTMKCVVRAIRNAPTADVVPKSEVEKIFEEIESLLDKHTMLIRTINGLGNMVFSRTLEVDIAELKKKYTEADNGETL